MADRGGATRTACRGRGGPTGCAADAGGGCGLRVRTGGTAHPEPFGGAAPEETGLITRWLAEPGVRIVSSTDGYAEATGCAASLRNWAAAARSAHGNRPSPGRPGNGRAD